MSESPEDDLPSSVLNAYQLRAGVYGHPQLCGIWQMGTSGHKRAAFHLVGRRNCWLHVRGARAPEPLQGGDLVVFPHDAWHMLTGTPELHGEENQMGMDGGGPFTTLVCGYFEFQAGDKSPILDALPEVIVVRRETAGRHLETIDSPLVSREARRGQMNSHRRVDRKRRAACTARRSAESTYP